MDPFDKHPAVVVVLADHERHFEDLATEVVDAEVITDTAFDPAASTWEGIAAPELRAAPEPARNRAYDVASDLTWAATATRVWAAYVRAFNATVDALQAERSLVPVEVERYLESSSWASMPIFDQDTIRERKHNELVQNLRRRWADAYEEHVESGSREVAGMLNRGPTWENLQAARQRGALTGTASPMVQFFMSGWEALAGPAEALRLAGLFNAPLSPQHLRTGSSSSRWTPRVADARAGGPAGRPPSLAEDVGRRVRLRDAFDEDHPAIGIPEA